LNGSQLTLNVEGRNLNAKGWWHWKNINLKRKRKKKQGNTCESPRPKLII